MSLRVVQVNRCLDKKLKLFGFEVADVFIILSILCVTNLLFSQTRLALVLVWMPTAIVGAALYFGKRGKPENYLIHWLRYHAGPGHFTAFESPSNWKEPPKRSS